MSKIVRKADSIEALQFFENGELWPSQVYTTGGLHYVDIDGESKEVFEGAYVVNDNGVINMLTEDEYNALYEVI